MRSLRDGPGGPASGYTHMNPLHMSKLHGLEWIRVLAVSLLYMFLIVHTAQLVHTNIAAFIKLHKSMKG